MRKILHLFTMNLMPQRNHLHCSKACRSRWSMTEDIINGPNGFIEQRIVSKLIDWGISFMCSRKSKGPKTVPCWDPELSGTGSDLELLQVHTESYRSETLWSNQVRGHRYHNALTSPAATGVTQRWRLSRNPILPHREIVTRELEG